jgi:hypothetical protein
MLSMVIIYFLFKLFFRGWMLWIEPKPIVVPYVVDSLALFFMAAYEEESPIICGVNSMIPDSIKTCFCRPNLSQKNFPNIDLNFPKTRAISTQKSVSQRAIA